MSQKDIDYNINTLLKISQTKSNPNYHDQDIPHSSKISNLNPIFHDKMIKVGVRIQPSNLPVKRKHQKINSKEHSVTKLSIRNVHEKNLQIGREHTLSILGENYYIPTCRGVIRKLLHDYFYCKRQNAKPTHPVIRTAIGNKPFTSVGMDYFGPILMKLTKQARSNTAKFK